MTSHGRRIFRKETLTFLILCVTVFASVFASSQGTNTNTSSQTRRRASASRSKAKTTSSEIEAPKVPSGVSPTMVEPQTMEGIDFTGHYEALVTFPREKLEAKGNVVVDGDKFTFDSGDVTLTGQIRTASLDQKTVRLKYKRPDGVYDTITLRLTQDGKKIWLKTVRGEDTSFKVALECPDPPGCMESDICRPFCK